MRRSTTSLAVAGNTRTHASGVLLILSDRLDGYDTFLTGRLEIGSDSVPVRILTLDDMTVLRPTSNTGALANSGHWEGLLHLSHGVRSRDIPPDLATEVARRRRDLTVLSDADLRYMLTFLGEATTKQIRTGRINAIVRTLPYVEHVRGVGRPVISLDVGGTLGCGVGPSLASRLIAASPLDPARARRVLRPRLHTLPELSPAAIGDICRVLQISPSAFPPKPASREFRPFLGAIDAIRRLSYHGTMVTLSNVTCLELDTDTLYRLFSPWIVDHFPSCQTGYAKPDPHAFQHVAKQFNTDIHSLIHIGDNWECDILGALGAGARAIYIARSGTGPEDAGATADGVIVARDLDHAVSLVGDIVRSHR